MSSRGITHIIHAASESSGLMGSEFIPNLTGVSHSVMNSLILAQRHGAHRVTIPYIGGEIFRDRIGVSHNTLTDTIIDSSLRSIGTLQI